jgi:hypothetical protein
MFVVAKLFFWILGIMFFVGMFGSALVVILTSIHDVRDLRERKETSETEVRSAMPSLKTS